MVTLTHFLTKDTKPTHPSYLIVHQLQQPFTFLCSYGQFLFSLHPLQVQNHETFQSVNLERCTGFYLKENKPELPCVVGYQLQFISPSSSRQIDECAVLCRLYTCLKLSEEEVEFFFLLICSIFFYHEDKVSRRGLIYFAILRISSLLPLFLLQKIDELSYYLM